MRVLLIDVNCKQGSTGKIVYDLYSHLIAKGEEAAVCYGRGAKIKEKNIFKFGLDWETYLHAFLTRLTGYTGCFSFFSTKRLIRFIKSFKPDVVHIHELHAYFVNITQLLHFLKSANICVVHTLHCEFSYTGKCGHSIDCLKWKTQCEKCSYLKNYISTPIFDRTKYMFRKKRAAFQGFKMLSIITPSQWLANRALESFLSIYPITVINNGIDTTVYYPRINNEIRQMFNIKDHTKMVLSLAPHLMSPTKGGYRVLKIAEKMKNDDVHFVLVGVDNVNINVPDNCTLVKPIYDKDTVAKFYSAADVFLICSENENFPTTCLEAQCCGTPVIGVDRGGIKETCLNKELVFAIDDYDGLISALRIIDRKTNDSIEDIKRQAIECFGVDCFFDKHYFLYKSLVAQKEEEK